MVKQILFKTEIVPAILHNMKNATRRAIKGFIPDDAIWGYTEFTPKGYISCRGTFADKYGEKFFRLPYQSGDIMYVREAFAKLYCVDINGYTNFDQKMYFYAADGIPDITLYDLDGFEEDDQRIRWHPSIHMPKEAARIWLKVMNVRVERLQDITDDGCMQEGIQAWTKDGKLYKYYPADKEGDFPNCEWYECPRSPMDAMKRVWNSTTRKSELSRYGWDANPWVWVIEFERCEKPESDG